jgi:hypothetical protein
MSTFLGPSIPRDPGTRARTMLKYVIGVALVVSAAAWWANAAHAFG